MGVSNNITCFVTLLLSMVVVGSGIWLATSDDIQCLKFVRWPLIVLGVLLLLVSVAGFVGAYWGVLPLLLLYLIFTILIIILLLVFIVFAFVVTHGGGKASGHPVPGTAYRDYRLTDFSGWLANYVDNAQHWRRIRACLSTPSSSSSSTICSRLSHRFLTARDFYNAHLDPLQSGCCKPPTVCGYNFVTPTYWTPSANTNQNADIDCVVWSNGQSQLCYDCSSCKAGVIAAVKQKWKKINVILIVVLIVMIWVYVIGCCAFRNAQTEELFQRYKFGLTR